MTVLVVTGTGTGVGKTVATAALACAAGRHGVDVTVCKPVQTGVAAGDDDLAEVGRLTGLATASLVGLARYPQPLAPAAAAERAGSRLPGRAELVASVSGAAAAGRLTLVEGAGGLLVALAADGGTLADLAVDLGAPVLVVTGVELGTLNHTALTLEALHTRRLRCAGLVIGSWPAAPGAAELSNRAALAGLAPVRAVLPTGAAGRDPADFAALSARAFDDAWLRGLPG